MAHRIQACLRLTKAISATRTVEGIYPATLDALHDGLGVTRASILLFDPDGVMRFKAWRGISGEYRAAVEGHTPWGADAVDPPPIVVGDVDQEPSLAGYQQVLEKEGIRALAQAHPDIPVYTAAVDRQLNAHGYILPGLGDAGDRVFGTK